MHFGKPEGMVKFQAEMFREARLQSALLIIRSLEIGGGLCVFNELGIILPVLYMY